ncbi:MAG: hydroxymethylglutaryl-CoA reductase, degradative [Candidatus Altiarchaeales archaeon]|nr:hydroxymethylglutaryl-CoA reductase, degradative [Candidatus Altiarchaeales archaeon]
MEGSRIPGFSKLNRSERVSKLGLSGESVKALEEGLSLEQAERMIENVVGVLKIPLGVATNFLINGRDYLIPMAIEEPSVVAAASNAAKMARVLGGFKAEASRPVMIGQIQLLDVDVENAEKKILEKKREIIELANKQDRILVEHGGGVVDVKTKQLKTKRGRMLVVYLLVDVRDAMGANAVNTMCEAVGRYLGEQIGCRTCLKIVSNYATERMVRATAIFEKEALGGENVVEAILDAQELAIKDVYRAVTHNKGIMNGIDAVAIATGNDFRAVEAGVHAYASRTGEYLPLTMYSKNKEGNLVGFLEIPLAVGIVGGATKANPTARVALEILKVKSACELAEVMASVGLAQNLAALRALATEGIQKGHMKLHARNIAVTAGARGEQIDKIAEQMVKEGNIKVDRARELL